MENSCTVTAFQCTYFVPNIRLTISAFRWVIDASIRITGKRNDAILLSAEDWAAIQETIHLLSVPGMRESIREGMALSIEECNAELEW